MEQKRDYYEVLGVQKAADEREIKRAYRKVAMAYHPDRNSSADAEAKFKEASEAYEVLSDPQRRQLYDQGGFEALRGGGFSGFSGAGMEDILSSFGDMFGDLFGFGRRGGSRTGGGQRGADLKARVRLSFEEAAFGCTRTLELTQYVACEGCHGTGGADGSQPQRCRTCQGRGQVVHGQGMFLVSSNCPDCQGQGVKQLKPCRVCDGSGRKRAQRSFEAKIPAGFDDGMSLRYSGEGEPGMLGGQPGDLYVTASVTPHATLKRDGEELYYELSLDMTQAALGERIDIEGLRGPLQIDIPAGTQPLDVVTVQGEGIPSLRTGARGALHVVCQVTVPTQLSQTQRELLEAFAQSLSGEKKRRRLFS